MQTPNMAPKLTGWARMAVCAVALAMLAGCSSVPDAMNPVEWYKGTRDAIVGKDERVEETAEAPPGADEPIPNLGTVPPRPRTSTSVDRDKIASGLIADQQGARKYSSDVIPRQSDVPQPPPPARPQAQAKPPAPSSTQAAAPTQAAPTAEQVRAAAPPPPPPVPSAPASAPTPPPAVAPAETATVAPQRSAPPGAPRTPPQMREVTAANIAPGTAQPIQPSNIVVPRENPQAPQLRAVTPYVPPAGLEQTETVYIGGSGASGGTRAATPASFRSVPPSSAVASEVPGTRPLSAYQGGGGRGSYQLASIQFSDGSAKLSDRDRAVLRGVYDQARRAGGTLRIVGHASSRTGARDVARHADANARVSAERAEAVARELVRLGMAPDAMYVGAVSDGDPRYFEFMPTGEAGNRRAEIFIDF